MILRMRMWPSSSPQPSWQVSKMAAELTTRSLPLFSRTARPIGEIINTLRCTVRNKDHRHHKAIDALQRIDIRKLWCHITHQDAEFVPRASNYECSKLDIMTSYRHIYRVSTDLKTNGARNKIQIRVPTIPQHNAWTPIKGVSNTTWQRCLRSHFQVSAVVAPGVTNRMFWAGSNKPKWRQKCNADGSPSIYSHM